MGHKDRDTGRQGLSRRDFVKATAATIAASGVADFAFNAQAALAYEDADGSGNLGYAIKTTTCPYCSASCGQRVVTDASGNNVIDLYGDYKSPFNSGGLCAKGAGSLQLVNNPRRIGAWDFTSGFAYGAIDASYNAHPVDPMFAYDGSANPVAYKRIGNGSWSRMTLDSALTEIVSGDASQNGLVSYRGSFGNDASGDRADGVNSQSVAFFGSSHLNNEPNYLYRRLIAQFGTTNTEHQARI